MGTTTYEKPRKIGNHTYQEGTYHYPWMTDSLYDESVFKIDGKKVSREKYYKSLDASKATQAAAASARRKANDAISNSIKNARSRFKKGNGKYYLKDSKGKWVQVSKNEYNLAASGYGPGVDGTIANVRANNARKKADGKKTTTGNSGGTTGSGGKGTHSNGTGNSHSGSGGGTHSSSSGSGTSHNSGLNGGGNTMSGRTSGYRSSSLISGGINFTNDSTSEMIQKVQRKYNQIFLARDHMKDFNDLQDIISKLESLSKTLKQYEEDYDDSKKADEAKVYTIDGVSQIPKRIDKIEEFIDKKGSKTSALYNLKTAAKKFVASYYRKEYDDCVRFGEYCDIAIRQCNSNILSKKKGDWDVAKSKVRTWKSKGNQRARKAKSNESNARTVLYKGLFLNSTERSRIYVDNKTR